jgi:aminoglycoside phosphotransferase (APT) family kinase protein
MTDLPGIRVDAVTSWLTAHAPEASAPFRFTPIAGGKSNLTYRVSDAAGHAWALRRPPLGHLLPTAHDMAREHRIVAALATTRVPVAPLVGLCEDPEVNGAPFYVMGFVDGVPLRTEPDARAVGPTVCARSCQSVVDTLVAIHEVDVDAIGLGTLGRKEGYVARQLKRWRQQYEDSKTRELPEIERVHEILVGRIPAQQGAGIVHGDYRHDNCLFAPTGDVRAVLDWELCTLGDVLSDVAQLLVYWCNADDPEYTLESPPTVAPGMWTRDEVVAAYAARSTRDLSDFDYYLAFAHWKVACIIEGVYARHAAGAMGADADAQELQSLKTRVELLARRAAEIAGRL